MLAAESGFFEWVTGLLAAGGGVFAYVIVVLLLFLAGWAFPLPEEPTVIAAGYVTAKNGLSMPLMLFCVLLGIQCGDLMIYYIGRKHGDWVFRLRLFRWLLPEARLAQARRLFAERGSQMAFFGRFIAGVRLVIFFTAGNLGVPVTTFILYDFLATLLTIPIGFFLGYGFADHIDQAFLWAKRSQWAVLAIVAVIAIVVIVKVRRSNAAAAAEAAAAAAVAPPPAEPPVIVANGSSEKG